jgi:DNA-binding transcriptional LysR family regulator
VNAFEQLAASAAAAMTGSRMPQYRLIEKPRISGQLVLFHSTMRRNDLAAMAIFAELAAERSFRGAARRLGLSVSAVSHAINRLEASIGVRLLTRTTRSVALTEAGERLLAQLKPALASITEAVETASASQASVSGTIRLTVPRTAAELALVPLATEFMKVHPGVTVEIIVQDGFTDIVAAGFDAGVRLGESLQQDMIAVPVGPMQRAAVVAAPSYFEARQIPRAPQDLHNHVCIRRRFGGGGLYRWEFERASKTIQIAVDGPLALNDDALIVQAALAGAGLAFAFEGQIAEHVAAGRLIRVLEDWCPRFPGFFLYYPSRGLMRPALRAFIDFTRENPIASGRAAGEGPSRRTSKPTAARGRHRALR